MSSEWDSYPSGDELTKEQIEDLKAEYGPIFKTNLDGTDCYFRTLTRRDVIDMNILDGVLEPDVEEAVFIRALVYPQSIDMDMLSAGDPSRIAQEVLERSGLSGGEWLNKYKERALNESTAYHTIATTICAAFPNIMPGTLDDLNAEALMRLLVQAEEIMAIRAKVNIGMYVPLTFDDVMEGATEMNDADRDAMVRAMLEGQMEDVPSGWIDRQEIPSHLNPMNPPDDRM